MTIPGARPTRLCLIRHGETDWNAERRLQGHIDIPLNDTGRTQAVAAGESLATIRFSVCFSSDLKRASETARSATLRHGIEIRELDDLRERHYGCLQGLTYTEASDRFPAVYESFLSRDPALVFPDGGESLAEFHERISRCLHRIVDTYPGKDVLIVTHGGVLDMAYRIASGMDLTAPRHFAIPNAALNWIHHDGNWSIAAWGDTSHLASVRDELPNA